VSIDCSDCLLIIVTRSTIGCREVANDRLEICAVCEREISHVMTRMKRSSEGRDPSDHHTQSTTSKRHLTGIVVFSARHSR
jgi:hypothetical protein